MTESNEKSLSSKEQYLTDIKHLRNDFLDDLPEIRVTYADPDYYRYKCTGGYFQTVIAKLEPIVDEGIVVDPTLSQKVNDFIDYISDERDFLIFISREDINKVNQILDDVIDSLS